MNNVIAKTALKTVLAVLIAAAVAFGVASLGFPAQMASLFENMGAYSFASGYASLAYTYSGKCSDLARCLDDSIFAGDDRNIVNFGDQLLARGDFADYCSTRNDVNYSQYASRNVACAKYRSGDKEGALKVAQDSLGSGFPVNNAVAALAVEAHGVKDREFENRLYEIIEPIRPNGETEAEYKGLLMQLLSEN